MRLHYEWSMIGVQCQVFVVGGFMANSHFSSILHFGLHFKSNLKGS